MLCWYLKCEKLRYPTPNPDAGQWNIGVVGTQRKIFASGMYISFFLCRFHLRLVPNANPISGGIWALGSIFHIFKKKKGEPLQDGCQRHGKSSDFYILVKN